MIYDAKAGHPGGSLSAADIVAALYFGEMNIRPEEPRWPDRDRFVLSKGHTCPIQYSALALTGFIPMEDLKTLRQFGSKLQGHPSMNRCPGVDISTGSLGQGIAVANGMGKGIVKRIGVQDWFGQSGPYDKLLEINGITKEEIVKTAEELLG